MLFDYSSPSLKLCDLLPALVSEKKAFVLHVLAL